MIEAFVGACIFAFVGYLWYRRYQRKANASWLAAARKAQLRDKLRMSMERTP